METQILMLIAVCGFFSVSEAISCYECLRHEVGEITGGNAKEHCEKVTEHTPKSGSTNCKACVRDSMDAPGYDYLKRYCWTDSEECKTGPVEQSIEVPVFKDPSYTVDRKCCTEDNCNDEFWDADSSASALQIAGSLLAAILMTLYYNMH